MEGERGRGWVTEGPGMTDHLGLRCPWNGAKRWMAADLAAVLQQMPRPQRYIEPFVGGGAVSHLVRRTWREVPQRVSDANPWLAAIYERMIAGPDAPIPDGLDVHAARSMTDQAAAAMTVHDRALRFAVCVTTAWANRWKTEIDGRFTPGSTPVKPQWCQPTYLRRRVGEILGPGWLGDGDFAQASDWRAAVEQAKPGDLVYLDPPYPETLGYGSQVWTIADGLDVIDWISDAARAGISVLVTYVADLERLLVRAGLRTQIIDAPTRTRTRRARREVVAWVAAPSAPQGPSMAALRELAAEFYSAGDEWAGVRLETVAGLVSPPVEPRSAPQADDDGHAVMDCAGEPGCGQSRHVAAWMCLTCEAHRYPYQAPRSQWLRGRSEASAPQAETPEAEARAVLAGEGFEDPSATLAALVADMAEDRRAALAACEGYRTASAPQGGPAGPTPLGEMVWLGDGEVRMGLPADDKHGPAYTVLLSKTTLPLVRQVLAASPPHGERPEPPRHKLEAAAHIQGARAALREVKRGCAVEDVEQLYAIGPEDFRGEDYPSVLPDDTTRPSMNVATPEAIDDVMNAVMAEALDMKRREVSAVLGRTPAAYVPNVGDPPEPWAVVEGGGLGRDDLPLISRPWHSGTMYAGVSYKGWLTCFVDDASRPTAMPPEAAQWLLAKTGGPDTRPPAYHEARARAERLVPEAAPVDLTQARAAAHADGAREALAKLRRGRSLEDVAEDYPGPESFGGEDFPMGEAAPEPVVYELGGWYEPGYSPGDLTPEPPKAAPAEPEDDDLPEDTAVCDGCSLPKPIGRVGFGEDAVTCDECSDKLAAAAPLQGGPGSGLSLHDRLAERAEALRCYFDRAGMQPLYAFLISEVLPALAAPTAPKGPEPGGWKMLTREDFEALSDAAVAYAEVYEAWDALDAPTDEEDEALAEAGRALYAAALRAAAAPQEPESGAHDTLRTAGMATSWPLYAVLRLVTEAAGRFLESQDHASPWERHTYAVRAAHAYLRGEEPNEDTIATPVDLLDVPHYTGPKAAPKEPGPGDATLAARVREALDAHEPGRWMETVLRVGRIVGRLGQAPDVKRAAPDVNGVPERAREWLEDIIEAALTALSDHHSLQAHGRVHRVVKALREAADACPWPAASFPESGPAMPEHLVPGSMASILDTLNHEERLRAAGRLPAVAPKPAPSPRSEWTAEQREVVDRLRASLPEHQQEVIDHALDLLDKVTIYSAEPAPLPKPDSEDA